MDAEGFLEAEKPGFKHYAVRDSGRGSNFKPAASNVAPRRDAWVAAPAPAQEPASQAGALPRPPSPSP